MMLISVFYLIVAIATAVGLSVGSEFSSDNKLARYLSLGFTGLVWIVYFPFMAASWLGSRT